MKLKRLRGALAALNVVLILGVVALAWATFFVRHEAKLPPLDVRGLALVPQPSTGADGYSVIWTQLDKPPLPPPPPPPEVKAVPSFEGSVAILALDPRDPAQRACIVQPRGASEQLYLPLGKRLGDYTCTSIAEDEAGWFVDVTHSSGASGRIRIHRD